MCCIMPRTPANEFDREKHVYHAPEFEELIKDAIRFFNGTPVHSIPPPERFAGAGVYAIYYIGRNPLYKQISDKNRVAYQLPIYVGKAVPSGWRQARNAETEQKTELFTRLTQHAGSIASTSTLIQTDFRCRFMIMEGGTSAMISTVEAAMISYYQPLWNSCIDGFGNHDPGSGRYNQARSDWDVLHPGREWADRCTGSANTLITIQKSIRQFWTSLNS